MKAAWRNFSVNYGQHYQGCSEIQNLLDLCLRGINDRSPSLETWFSCRDRVVWEASQSYSLFKHNMVFGVFRRLLTSSHNENNNNYYCHNDNS